MWSFEVDLVSFLFMPCCYFYFSMHVHVDHCDFFSMFTSVTVTQEEIRLKSSREMYRGRGPSLQGWRDAFLAPSWDRVLGMGGYWPERGRDNRGRDIRLRFIFSMIFSLISYLIFLNAAIFHHISIAPRNYY